MDSVPADDEIHVFYVYAKAYEDNSIWNRTLDDRQNVPGDTNEIQMYMATNESSNCSFKIKQNLWDIRKHSQ